MFVPVIPISCMFSSSSRKKARTKLDSDIEARDFALEETIRLTKICDDFTSEVIAMFEGYFSNMINLKFVPNFRKEPTDYIASYKAPIGITFEIKWKSPRGFEYWKKHDFTSDYIESLNKKFVLDNIYEKIIAPTLKDWRNIDPYRL